MNPISKALAGAALALAGAAAAAHGGHPVAAGVPSSGHLHLWDGLAVGPQWLVVPGLALVLAVVVWRRGRGPARRRAPAADDVGRGSRRASR